jgi:glycerophosphoryl diester phosphodiesterase
MKRFILLYTLAALMQLGCSFDANEQAKNVESIREAFLDSQNATVLIAAHRGDWRNAPENSVLAIEMAIAKGVDIVEIDLRQTKDGQLVLMHDATLDRTTSGKGNVSDWSLDSLKTLYLKNGLGRVTQFKIPTLEEALLTAKGKVMINLDKCYDYFPEAYEVLRKTETIDHIIMKGWYPYEKVREDLGEYLDEIIYMPVISLDDPSAGEILADFQAKMKPKAYEFIFSTDTSRIIDQFSDLKKEGARIWVNALWSSLCAGHDDDLAVTNPEASWGWLIDKKVGIIQTDRPDILNDYLSDLKAKELKSAKR